MLSVLLQGIQLEWKVWVWNDMLTSFVNMHMWKTNMDDNLLCGGESRQVQDQSKFFCHYFELYRSEQSSVTAALFADTVLHWQIYHVGTEYVAF